MSVLDEHPRMQEFQREFEEVDRLEAASFANLAALLEPWEADVSAWRVERDVAVEQGVPIPSVPARPDTSEYDGLPHLWMAKRREIEERMNEAIAEIAPEVEEIIQRRIEARRIEAARHVKALGTMAVAESEDLDSLKRVRRAQDQHNRDAQPSPGYGLADRTRSSVTLTEFVEAVHNNVDLTVLKPLPPRQTGDVVISDGPPPNQRKGGLKKFTVNGITQVPPLWPTEQPHRRVGEI